MQRSAARGADSATASTTARAHGGELVRLRDPAETRVRRSAIAVWLALGTVAWMLLGSAAWLVFRLLGALL